MKRLSAGLTSLTTRIILTAIVAVTAASMLIAGLTWRTLDAEIAHQMDEKTRWSLRVAAEAFIAFYPDFSLIYDKNGDVTRLVGPPIPDFNDNEAVDRVTKINKGTATVFRYDAAKNDFVRLSTSVKKADGTRAIGTALGNSGIVFPYIMRGEVYNGRANILGIPYQTGYMPINTKDGKPSGILYIGVGKIEELRASTDGLYRDLLIAAGVALAFAALGAGLVSRRLMAPLPKLASATRDIADEKIGVEVPYQQRADEVGLLARSLASLKASVEERNELRDRDNSEKQSELEKARQRDEDITAFRQAVSDITARISAGSERMGEASRMLNDVVASTARGADGAKAAADQANHGISTVATSADQLNGSIREVAGRAEEATRIVGGAVGAGRGSQQGIMELAATAGRIGDVVTTIRAIAEQTNLLALNATIEAARAGESGRGFAVVANEVKTLATQTSKATEEIAEQVTQMQSASDSVVKVFESIFSALNDIDTASGAIAASVEEQGAATGEIARSASQAAQGAEEMSLNIVSVERMVSKAAESVAMLEETSEAFRSDAGSLVSEIESFLKKVA
jgi:methyl-accepting chemotaxis protein